MTSISAGTGITLTPSPITGVGSVVLTIPVVVSSGGSGLRQHHGIRRPLWRHYPDRPGTISRGPGHTRPGADLAGGRRLCRSGQAPPGGGGGSGTVTSVAATAPVAGFTITGSPITTAGTLTFALADDLAALEALTGTNTIYYRSGASAWSPVTVSTGLNFAGGILTATVGAGVSSINTLTGAVTLVAGANITITPAGNTLTIAAAAGGAGFVTAIADTPTVDLVVTGTTLSANVIASGLPKIPGEILGKVSVVVPPTSNRKGTGVSSLTPGHLIDAAPMTFSFTLALAADVLFLGFGKSFNTGTGNPVNGIFVNVDGTSYELSAANVDSSIGNFTVSIAGALVLNLAAGVHNIAMLFGTTPGNNNSFAFYDTRTLIALRA